MEREVTLNVKHGVEARNYEDVSFDFCRYIVMHRHLMSQPE